MHAVLVAGSTQSGVRDPARLGLADVLIAVDGGAESVVRAGFVPQILVGDMDSISVSTLRFLEGQAVEVVTLPKAKDETDTEAALRLAVDRGAGEVTVYGALGGPRLDHLVGNLLLLTASWLQNVRVRMIDDRTETFLVQGDSLVEGRPGDLVSLLPLSSVVERVRTEGLLYPLAGEALYRFSTRGVSNVMTAPVARVTHGEGVLLLIHLHQTG